MYVQNMVENVTACKSKAIFVIIVVILFTFSGLSNVKSGSLATSQSTEGQLQENYEKYLSYAQQMANAWITKAYVPTTKLFTDAFNTATQTPANETAGSSFDDNVLVLDFYILYQLTGNVTYLEVAKNYYSELLTYGRDQLGLIGDNFNPTNPKDNHINDSDASFDWNSPLLFLFSSNTAYVNYVNAIIKNHIVYTNATVATSQASYNVTTQSGGNDGDLTPGIISLLCDAYQFTGNSTYLEYAVKLGEWRWSLVNKNTYLMYDTYDPSTLTYGGYSTIDTPFYFLTWVILYYATGNNTYLTRVKDCMNGFIQYMYNSTDGSVYSWVTPDGKSHGAAYTNPDDYYSPLMFTMAAYSLTKNDTYLEVAKKLAEYDYNLIKSSDLTAWRTCMSSLFLNVYWLTGNTTFLQWSYNVTDSGLNKLWVEPGFMKESATDVNAYPLSNGWMLLNLISLAIPNRIDFIFNLPYLGQILPNGLYPTYYYNGVNFTSFVYNFEINATICTISNVNNQRVDVAIPIGTLPVSQVKINGEPYSQWEVKYALGGIYVVIQNFSLSNATVIIEHTKIVASTIPYLLIFGGGVVFLALILIVFRVRSKHRKGRTVG